MDILTRGLDSVRVGDTLADVIVSWLNITEPVQQPYPVLHNLQLEGQFPQRNCTVLDALP